MQHSTSVSYTLIRSVISLLLLALALVFPCVSIDLLLLCRLVKMPCFNLTMPTVEQLASPDYEHPWLSMFPPSKAQLLQALALRKKLVPQQTMAAAPSGAEGTEVPPQDEPKVKPVIVQTDMSYCYHQCGCHKAADTPEVKRTAKKGGERAAAKSDKKDTGVEKTAHETASADRSGDKGKKHGKGILKKSNVGLKRLLAYQGNVS